MNGYYPWGPHGPQSSPTQVTPNPTPAYVPPPAYEPPPVTASYSNPVSYDVSGGGYSGSVVGYSSPPTKGYFFSIILAAVFGPIGLLYSNAKAAKLLLLLVAANTAWRILSTPLPDIKRAGGYISFMEGNQSITTLWSLATFLSVILSVIGVRSLNTTQIIKETM